MAAQRGDPDHTLLVTGASRPLGRRVVGLLLRGGAGRVIAASRCPERLADLSIRGVEVRRVDFDDPASLPAAFAGAGRLFLTSGDVIGRPVAQHCAAIAAAGQAGVRYVVYPSVPRAEDSAVSFAHEHLVTEQALAASGLAWTVLRNNLLTESLVSKLVTAIAFGRLVAAAENGAAAYVTREDCARAAAAALMLADPGRATLDVTGPEAVTHERLARLVTRLSGHRVAYVQLLPEEMRDGLIATGEPADQAVALASFDVAIARGHLAAVSDTVERLTGCPPMCVEEFLAGCREIVRPDVGCR